MIILAEVCLSENVPLSNIMQKVIATTPTTKIISSGINPVETTWYDNIQVERVPRIIHQKLSGWRQAGRLAGGILGGWLAGQTKHLEVIWEFLRAPGRLADWLAGWRSSAF